MREPQHAYISSMEVDSDGYNSNKYDDKFSKLTPVPKKISVFEAPPQPQVQISTSSLTPTLHGTIA